MILTQPPPSFLLDVTLFTVFFLELVPNTDSELPNIYGCLHSHLWPGGWVS